MRGFLPLIVLIATLTWAQMNSAAPAGAPGFAPGSDKSGQAAVAVAGASANVPPNAAVLTIKGLCEEPGDSAGSTNSRCATVITRAQFEDLVQMLRVEKDPEARRALMTAYPETLVMAHEAERRGIDKDARFEERLRFARLQILSQELVNRLKEEAAQVPQKDIEDYYQQNTSQFEQFSVERIVIPNRAQGTKQGSRDEAGMTQLANALQARAAAGEDFVKLQKEAYDAAGLSGGTEPNPRMEKMRRHGLPPTQTSVFDLKAGEVSAVISDDTGHYIFKLESKEIEPLDAVKSEISKTLRRQRMEKTVREIQQAFTTEVNRVYFGPDGKPARN
jgi:PPIC-type PPIASE domain